MIYLLKPSPEKLLRYLRLHGKDYCTFPYAGITKNDGIAPHGFNESRVRQRIGDGKITYVNARAAIDSMAMFDVPGISLVKLRPELKQGAVLGILARRFPLYIFNPVRVSYTLNERGGTERYGFAIATLPGHEEIGEERFTVVWRHEGQAVWFERFSFFRSPHGLGRRIMHPLVRYSEHRFMHASARAFYETVHR